MKAKKLVRKRFRDSVFNRDNYCCKICGKSGKSDPDHILDAHHITNRNLFKNGGYVLANGIALCKGGEESCHYKAEKNKYTVDYLYGLINSSFEKAVKHDSY